MEITLGSCDVVVLPEEVDAGGEATLNIEVTGPEGEDLRGLPIRITDHAGALVETISIDRFDGQVNRATNIAVRVPDTPGSYTWRVTPGEEGDDSAPVEPVSFTVTAKAHSTRLLVWDVPTAIEAGRRFGAKIGVKCSSGCDMTGRGVEIVDAAGAVQASDTLSGDLWPGSDGLYRAEFDLPAPDKAEQQQWQARVLPAEGRYHHEAMTSAFNVRTVPPAEYTVRIEAVDRETEAPLPNMSVVMHPYRAMTDAEGVATLAVAGGSYTAFVSGRGYYPARREMDVEEDITTRAPLEAEPPPSKDL